MLLLANKKATASIPFADKIITVKVNTAGIIYVGRDTISSDELALYIRQRLFKSYTGTGKMYDGIKLVKDGEPEKSCIRDCTKRNNQWPEKSIK